MRRHLIPALFAALALLLAACDGAEQPEAGEPTPTPGEEADGDDAAVDDAALDRLIAAVENTEDEGTARFTVTVGQHERASGTGTDAGATDDADAGTTGDGDDGGTNDDSGDTGTDGGATGDAHTGDTAGDVRIEGEVDFDADQREFELHGPEGQLTAIIDGEELYVQIPAAEEGEWARIELADLAGEGAQGGPAGLLFQDPHATLTVLRDAAVEVQELSGSQDTDETTTGTEGDTDTGTTDDAGDDGGGTDDADATSTPDADETTATPTPDADEPTATPTPDADDTAPGTDEPDFLVLLDLGQVDDAHWQFRQQAEQSGADEIEVEVWVDDEERVEQVRYTLPTAQARIDDEAVDPTPTPDEDAGTTGDDTDTDSDDTETGTTDDGDTGADDDPVEAEVDPEIDIVVTIRYEDFGTEVDITTPDEQDVVDLDEDELRRAFGDAGAGGAEDSSDDGSTDS